VKSLTAIIPIYNEANNLEKLINELNLIDDNVLSFCIFVNDGSSDNSQKILSDSCTKLKIPHRIITKDNGGKSSAVKVATEYLQTTHAIIFDADLEYSVKDISKIWNLAVEEGFDFVLSYRKFYAHSSYSWQYSRGNQLLSNLFGLVYNLLVTDVMCCFKLMPSIFLKNLPFRYKGFGIDVEIPMQIWRTKSRIKEVEVSYNPRSRLEGKSISVLDGLKIFFYLLHFRTFYRRLK
jgi:glycosyltransferase involved in cell wall biosynthesis